MRYNPNFYTLFTSTVPLQWVNYVLFSAINTSVYRHSTELLSAPYHKSICGRGCTAPPILKFCSRWRWVVRFTLRSLYSRVKSIPFTHRFDRKPGGPRAVLDLLEKPNISCHCRESSHDFSVTQPISWSLYWLSYPFPYTTHKKDFTLDVDFIFSVGQYCFFVTPNVNLNILSKINS